MKNASATDRRGIELVAAGFVWFFYFPAELVRGVG